MGGENLAAAAKVLCGLLTPNADREAIAARMRVTARVLTVPAAAATAAIAYAVLHTVIHARAKSDELARVSIAAQRGAERAGDERSREER